MQTDFPATYYATEGYETGYPSPANSSGWFSPSIVQGKRWYNNRNVILASVRKVTDDNSYKWEDFYWSGSESSYDPESHDWAWGVIYNSNFDFGSTANSIKLEAYCVRGVFAF